MDNTQQVKRNTILAYGGLATPLAMIGYPIAIWLIPFYSEVVGIPLYIIANILLILGFVSVINPIIFSDKKGQKNQTLMVLILTIIATSIFYFLYKK